MGELRLGPLLRHVDAESATVWVETDRPCGVVVRCADGTTAAERTWQVAGHHYALVVLRDLAPGTSTAYEVFLDDTAVWPRPDSPFPPSTIRTLPGPGEERELRVAFGSCRWSAPPAGASHDPVGPDALDTLARALAGTLAGSAGDGAAADGEDGPGGPARDFPDVLVLLGDQVYADEPSPAVTDRMAERRDLAEAPWKQAADYEEYTYLYDESWRDPEVRWLLSTVPSCMIFDDHDVIDDWNTSAAWLAEMRATSWWSDRIVGGLMSYWVYQHLGNLSPAALDEDELYAKVRASGDGTTELRDFAVRADADPAVARWSYRRDFGRVRLVVADCRAARVLDGERRAMLDPEEARWFREQVLEDPAGCDHLLIGSSLPWLLPHLVHDLENWNAAMCAGVRGERWAARGERLRRKADLEHWPAFPESFDELSETLALAASRTDGPATVSVLSGDVHHSYAAEARWDDRRTAAPVRQLTCSPVHNSIPGYMVGTFRFGWSRAGRALGRLVARHAKLPRRRPVWHRAGGPWFGNHLMTLTLRGRTGRVRLERADRGGSGEVRWRAVWDNPLTHAQPSPGTGR